MDAPAPSPEPSPPSPPAPAALPAVPADLVASAVCEGGDLDCGSGLLLIIRRAMEAVPPGGVLEVGSTERSVREDLPAWCRMTGHPYLGSRAAVASDPPGARGERFFVRRGAVAGAAADDSARALAAARAHRWRARAVWRGGPGARVYCRNHAFEVGQSASFDLEDAAPSAVELVLGALGGALAGGLAVLASQRGVEVRHLEVALHAGIADLERFLGLGEGGRPALAGIAGDAWIDADADDATLDALWTETLARSPLVGALAGALAGGAAPAIALRRVE